MNNPNRNTSAEFDNLGRECLEHLDREAESLQGFLQHAMIVQEAVINGQDANEADFQLKQQQLDNDAAQLNSAREQIRQKISLLTGKPGELVSVKLLAQHVAPELAGKITERRQLILDLTESIAAANRTNFLLIQQTIDMQNRLQMAISGQSPQVQTYGASGQMNRTTDSTMLETEC